ARKQAREGGTSEEPLPARIQCELRSGEAERDADDSEAESVSEDPTGAGKGDPHVESPQWRVVVLRHCQVLRPIRPHYAPLSLERAARRRRPLASERAGQPSEASNVEPPERNTRSA